MKQWTAKIMDRFFVVVFALIFLQLPLFMQHYQQNLVGHVDELQWQIDSMREVAFESGKTLEQFIEKFVTSDDQDFSGQGEVMSKMVIRWEKMSASLQALTHASVLARPLLFLFHLRWDIASSSYKNFTFGIPFSLEGVIYAAVGMLVGYFVFRVFSRMFGRVFSSNRPRHRTTHPHAIVEEVRTGT